MKTPFETALQSLKEDKYCSVLRPFYGIGGIVDVV